MATVISISLASRYKYLVFRPHTLYVYRLIILFITYLSARDYSQMSYFSFYIRIDFPTYISYWVLYFEGHWEREILLCQAMHNLPGRSLRAHPRHPVRVLNYVSSVERGLHPLYPTKSSTRSPRPRGSKPQWQWLQARHNQNATTLRCLNKFNVMMLYIAPANTRQYTEVNVWTLPSGDEYKKQFPYAQCIQASYLRLRINCSGYVPENSIL